MSQSPPKKTPQPSEDAEERRPLVRALVDRLLDEVERDCADEDAGAEAHDQADPRSVDADEERRDRADDERGGGEEPPAERRAHQASAFRPTIATRPSGKLLVAERRSNLSFDSVLGEEGQARP